MMSAVRSIFGFFWFIGRKARRTRVLALLCALPILAALIIQSQKWFSGAIRMDGLKIFSDIIMAFYLQFIVLILSLFFGTSVVSEEVEGKTLPFLTTRPVSKPAIILGKYGASLALSSLLIAGGVIGSFVLLASDRLGSPAAWGTLGRNLGVLLLGLVVYMAVFTFAGTFLKKSILFGLFFSFGWENVVQYFPGSTQKFTIIHYLKSILRPDVAPESGPLSFLAFHLQPTPLVSAVLILLAIAAIALAAAAFVFSRREYLFEE